eukprot:Pgem_evm1s16441
MECCICFELPKIPIDCGNCTGAFCMSCLETWAEKNNTCPICRIVLLEEKSESQFGDETNTTDSELVKKVDKKEMVCPNKGCKEKFSLSKISSHFRSCSFTFNVKDLVVPVDKGNVCIDYY